MTLIFRDAETGHELDRVTDNGDELAYATGRAANMMGTLTKLTGGLTGRRLLEAVDGWSNGHLMLEAA